ncbi:nuclear transport factor 2 family protein [Chryseobacterium sp. Ch-15]|uniref:Nuclear transport factor 2 family protein n=1 Tax=Chryseobacterium muglaense TaxID=2893752 RepID=A0A9Q3UZF6_9FLAO|nr:nuclear transport factor 2 family protein [Chryseobacterium muglaense]MBD3903401.1 nuclear transport factor 2 family protein [Chryseobacterium muglaense]MCC9036301.1 nuclear transport factor 2 family protein [Chryseobacterium muglaense]MCM2554820.1 nuclear transport factor 2 family protein [Chryseobacterium muglaense]
MTLEILKTKEDLRNLIDDYAHLGDEKKIAEQMELFTSDLNYQVYMGGALVADVSGRETMERDFNLHSSEVKTYFTLNGQHTVKINDETASGVSYSQIKMIREIEGKDVLTDYSVKYDDHYVKINGKWLIKDRVAHFVILKSSNLL